MSRGRFAVATLAALAVALSSALVPLSEEPRAAASLSARPRLLIDDVAALRARITSGEPAKAWPHLRARADVVSDPTHPLRANPDDVAWADDGQNQAGSYLTDLAMAYVLTGDVRYGDAAVALMVGLANGGWPSWSGNELGEGDLQKGLALAYDWTHDRMSAQDQQTILDALVAELPTLDGAGNVLGNGYEAATFFSCLDEDWAPRTRPGHNWYGVCGGGAGLLLLAIEGEPGVPDLTPYLQVARGRVANYLPNAVASKGDYTEGHLYLSYGFHNALPFAFAWQDVKGEDIIPPQIEEVSTFLAFEQLPGDGMRFVPRNDANVMAGLHQETIPMLLEADPDGVSAWLYDHTMGPAGDDVYSQPAVFDGDQYPGTDPCVCVVSGEPWVILYHRDAATLPRVRPDLAGVGHTRHYPEHGLVAMRTGWSGTNEVVATFEAKHHHLGSKGHAQYDQGSFTVYGYGGRFAIDTGYGHDYSCTETDAVFLGCDVKPGDPTINSGKSGGHSVVVLDHADNSQQSSAAFATYDPIRELVDVPNLTYLRSDLKSAYAAPVRARRDMFFGHVPGEPVIVAVTDGIQRDNRDHDYGVKIHTDVTNAATSTGPVFTVTAPSGAVMNGAVTAVEPRRAVHLPVNSPLTPNPAFLSQDAVGFPKRSLDHLAVMALTPAGATPAVVTPQVTTSGNLAIVSWVGNEALVVSAAPGVSTISSRVVSDADFAKITANRGETVLAGGTWLVVDGRTYVSVTGGEATVAVSGTAVRARGRPAGSYRVYAPSTITSVTVDGTAVPFTRVGADIVF